MTTFWNLWIVVLTVGNIAACLWLIRWTMKARSDEAATGDVTGHVWDEDLQEYNNPLPRWWLWLFYLTLLFAVIYLALYPGLGSFQGLFGWSSHGTQYAQEMQAAEQKYGPIFQQYAAVPVDDLATQPEYAEARAMGKRLFLTYCIQCHGSDARGSRGYPNLTDNDWLWGGDAAQITTSIADGRNGVMPAHAHLNSATVDDLVTYVHTLQTTLSAPAANQVGQQAFMNAGCAGCHGPDAKGNPLLGAPNLTDDIWLYGGSRDAIHQTITAGRSGVMPAHRQSLGDDKVHLLAAYVSSLSR